MWFKPSPPSIGAEYELQLLDARTLDLADEIDSLLRACPERRYVTAEYFQPTVEIVSRVCDNVRELEAHLLAQLDMLQTAADRIGLKLAGAGTHPFSERQVGTTAGRRYRKLLAVNGNANFLQVSYGLHVHVGMQSGEQAIRVMNRLRPYLPLLLALSANSPYLRGVDTGFASYRQRMLMTMHAFGLPPRFADWDSFSRMAEVSQRAGVFAGLKDMHWDLRPRPDFGTLEIRVMDSQPGVHETAMLAAVCQVLVEFLKQAPDTALHIPELPEWMEQENHYRSSQLGMQAHYLVDREGAQRPLRELAAELLEDLAAVADSLGCRDLLREVQERVEAAADPAQQQRSMLRSTGSMHGLVSGMAERLAAEARTLH